MPRLVYLTGVGIGLAAVAFALTYALLGPPPAVTEANVRRIKPGMTLAEVEAILGGLGREGTGPARMRMWPGAGGYAFVYFQGDSTVRDAFFWPFLPGDGTKTNPTRLLPWPAGE